jgi:hypothetical protein
MEGIFAKRKERKEPELQHKPPAPKVSPFDRAQIIAQKKKEQVCQPLSISMTEGPMLLKSVQESRKIEEGGRASYEKSVKIELGTLKGKGKKGKKGKKKEKKKGK